MDAFRGAGVSFCCRTGSLNYAGLEKFLAEASRVLSAEVDSGSAGPVGDWVPADWAGMVGGVTHFGPFV